MLNPIRRFFTAPVFEGNDEKTHASELVNTILLIQLEIFTLVFIGNLISRGQAPPARERGAAQCIHSDL